MAVLPSVVIIVVPPCLAHIVGGTMILPLFAMCGRVADIRNDDRDIGLLNIKWQNVTINHSRVWDL